MTAPTVSIVIIAHSVRPELERCLASIDRYAATDVETILVDNASTDGTREWVRQAHPDVTVIPLRENVGEAAREFALDRVSGRFTMFLDSDAALTEGALPRLVAALDAHRDWGLVAPRLVYDDGSLQRSCRRFPPLLLPLLRRPPFVRLFEHRQSVSRHLMTDFGHDHTRPVLYMISACCLFRTELGQRARPYPSIFFGWSDAEWCLRIRDAGGEIVFVADATAVHSYRRYSRQRPLSRSALRQLVAFVHFQRTYWRRRRELIELSRELDRQARSA